MHEMAAFENTGVTACNFITKCLLGSQQMVHKLDHTRRFDPASIRTVGSEESYYGRINSIEIRV